MIDYKWNFKPNGNYIGRTIKLLNDNSNDLNDSNESNDSTDLNDLNDSNESNNKKEKILYLHN